jgi:sugar lactone lactonase YvrE
MNSHASRIRPHLATLLASIAIAQAGIAQAPPVVANGEAQIIQTLPAGDNPEGIAFDGAGNLYFSNRRIEAGLRVSRVMKIDTGGQITTLATLGASAASSQAVLGLEYAHGYVYAAYASFDPTTHGVWRVDANTGTAQRLAGSVAIFMPNGLAFDPSGRLYVTDSAAGKVWRFPKNPITNPCAVWSANVLLTPVGPHPILPPVGANGIAFYPDATNAAKPATGHFYVANTQRGLVARIPLLTDGSAGAVQLVAASPKLLSIDGIAMDSRGNVYGVIAGFAVLPVLFGIHTSAIVRVEPNAPPAERVVPIPTDGTKFDFPLSIAFGRGQRDQRSVFVTSGDLFSMVFPIGPGPGIAQAGVGITGKK